MTSIFARTVVTVLGVAGLGLVSENMSEHHAQASMSGNNMLQDAFYNHSKETMFDYSGNPTFTSIKDAVTNPNNPFLTYEIATAHVKSMVGQLLSPFNFIPLTLSTVGLFWVYGGTLNGIKNAAKKFIVPVFKKGWEITKGIGRATAQVFKMPNVSSWFSHFTNMQPKEILALTLSAGLLTWFGSRLIGEFNGVNREQFANYLENPDTSS